MVPPTLKELVRDPLHFVGIEGSGMAGLAELALRLGLRVQGSDLRSTKISQRLSDIGAVIRVGHDAASLGDAKTLVYSSAIRSDNVELLRARELNLTLLHRSDFLGMLMRGRHAVTVAGTHGKSTTSAMITHVLDALGQDPMAAIGGTMCRYQSAARFGRGGIFVAEADESDGSFLKYGPYIGVLTNIDLDHMEFYKDRTRLTEAFEAYLATIVADGVAVIGWDNALARQVAESYAGERLTYGFLIGSEVRALDYRCERGRTTFSAVIERDRVSVQMNGLGRHNVQNALAALAVVRALGLDVRLAAESLSTFAGVERRMTQVYGDTNFDIFDDYAHNPGKVAASIAALRAAWPERELHVVYQPHRFSRLETMYDAMLESLQEAGKVYVVPVYSAGEITNQDFSPKRLAQDLNDRYALAASACASLEEAAKKVYGALREPAVILTVGAGDVWQVSSELKALLEARSPL